MSITVCLNMIVKNESHVILETLKLLTPYINYWVICDTGSTDNTKEIITEYFKEVNISGEMYDDPWMDFDINRTLAITRAYKKADYIFVFDADDKIQGKFEIPNKEIDSYFLKIGSFLKFKRKFLFKGDLRWRYKSVVHEFCICESKNPITEMLIEGDYNVISCRTGARNLDPNKYFKDIKKILSRYDNEPDLKSRYQFYLGQSYFDKGDYDSSMIWYEKRTKSGGYEEEIYYSHLRIAECMTKKEYDVNEIIDEYQKAIKFLPERLEAYFYSGILWKNNNLEMAEKFLEEGENYKNLKKYSLFIRIDIYNWLNTYELAKVKFELDKYEEALEILETLEAKPEIKFLKKQCLIKVNRASENKLKIINLILYNPTTEYDLMKENLEIYLKNKNINYYFYVFDENLIEKYKIENRIIYIRGKEDYISGILYKTIQVLKLFEDYDYIVRSNISTFIDFDILNTFMEDNPSDYTGPSRFLYAYQNDSSGYTKEKIEQYGKFPFISGICIILSEKSVNFILENEELLMSYGLVDDLAIGLLMMKEANKLNKLIIPWNYYSNNEMEKKDCIAYRNKRSNRNEDVKAIKYLVEKRLLRSSDK